MSSIAGPCLYCHGGVLQRSGLPGNQLRRCRSEPIEVAQFRVAAIAGESGDNPASVGTEAKERGSKGKSAQLQRWARARRIRSGRTVDSRKVDSPVVEAVKVVKDAPLSVGIVPNYESDEEVEDGVQGKNAREVYMISDGTGWTADHAVQAALGQFENCFVDQRCSVDTHLFSQVSKVGFGVSFLKVSISSPRLPKLGFLFAFLKVSISSLRCIL